MTTYFRDFSEADGISDWTQRNVSGTSPTWAIQNTDEVFTTASSAVYETLTWDDIDGDANRNNIEVVGEMQFSAASSYVRVFSVRQSGTTGYTVRTSNNALTIVRYSGATHTAFASLTKYYAPNAWVWYRFRCVVNGGTSDLKFRTWTGLASDEPGTWDIETTDSTYTAAGNVGFMKGAVTSANQTYRKFGVGTNGDTAPTAAAAGAPNITALSARLITANSVQPRISYS